MKRIERASGATNDAILRKTRASPETWDTDSGTSSSSVSDSDQHRQLTARIEACGTTIAQQHAAINAAIAQLTARASTSGGSGIARAICSKREH